MENEDLSKLPAHVRSVRDGLLDFDRFMGLQAAMLIVEENDEDTIPLSAYKLDGVGKGIIDNPLFHKFKTPKKV